ncbi:terminase gpA endonuclease subunit [Geopsychrobacter electrodiphilus]|uniref:terminase gpA endonuclease subunit n=1 Tax=Geopsychrobacter electrodiphilus TaxID=225196 RepID=UPI00037FA002|nr:terminase gpA endonuclease subunit [Geopsychrobacter electrodiphilus]
MTNLAHDYSWLPEPPPRVFTLLPGEVAVMRAATDETVSQWAHGERQVHVSPFPGSWDNDTTPYAVSIMDLYSSEHLRELYIAGGSQTAKTDISHNCWGWTATHEPGPALISMQDRATGSETMNDRFIPMIKDTPSLRRLRTKNSDDISLTRVRLKNGMVTYLAWGNSEGRAASKPIRYLFLSEVDLYPPHMIKKLRARTGAFEGMYKILEECTVSTEEGRIWSVQHQVQARYDIEVKCPHCGEYQIMDPANIQWLPEVVEPSALIRDEDAWYLCTANNCKWDDHDRDEAVRHHRLAAREGSITDKPESAWVHLSPLVSPFNKFRRVAKAYLTTLLEPTHENLVFYYNDCCGLPVPEDTEGELPQEKDLYERRENYAPDGAKWTVPMEACFITADLDFQGNRAECEVVAWGPGDQSWGLEYIVFHGKILEEHQLGSESKLSDQIHEWLQARRYKHESGAELEISIAGFDIGYATDDVTLLVKRSRKYRAHKGSNTAGLPLLPLRPSKTKRYRVPFYELGTETGKEKIYTWLSNDQPGPMYCNFPSSYGFEYFRMLVAEEPKRERDRKTGKQVIRYKLRKGYVRNESLDIRVGNLAMKQLARPDYEKLSAALKAQAEGQVVFEPKRRRTSNKRKRHD